MALIHCWMLSLYVGRQFESVTCLLPSEVQFPWVCLWGRRFETWKRIYSPWLYLSGCPGHALAPSLQNRWVKSRVLRRRGCFWFSGMRWVSKRNTTPANLYKHRHNPLLLLLESNWNYVIWTWRSICREALGVRALENSVCFFYCCFLEIDSAWRRQVLPVLQALPERVHSSSYEQAAGTRWTILWSPQRDLWW